MRFKGILLDLDNTLYAYDPAHAAGLAAALAYLAHEAGIHGEEARRHYQVARKRVNEALAETAASHNRLLYFQGACESLGLSSMDHALKLYSAYWDTFLEAMRLDEGALDFLEGARKARVCLVTDLTAQIQFRKIERLGLARYLDYVVTSEETGREKPHASMFRLGMEKTGTLPSETCMIGDNYEKDALGARSLGITAFWLNRDNEAKEVQDGINDVRSLVDLGAHLHA